MTNCFLTLICGDLRLNTEGFLHVLQFFVYAAVVIFFLIVGFPFLLALIARLEKQMIHCFEPCGEPDPSTQSDYLKAVNQSARDLGFLFCGWYHCIRGGPYRAVITAWLSEDLRTLLITAGGKMAGVDLKKMALHSMAIDGPVLLTCDEDIPPDLSGLLDVQVLWNADLRELYDLHLTRIAPWENELEFFDSASILEDYEMFDQKRVRILVNAGFAEYVDYSQNQWRYTWKGAFALKTRFVKSLKRDRSQAYRFGPEFKRPGSAEEPETKIEE